MKRNKEETGMKKWITIGALVVLMAAGFVYPNPAEGATTSYEVFHEYGTVTYKFVIDTDSNEAIGHFHKSGEAVKTAWVHVPVGVPYTIFTECRDSDSGATTFTADTIHIALETAPFHGLAFDSVTSAFKRMKASIIWNLANGLSYTALTSQHFFPATPLPDTAFQTLAEAAAAVDTIAYLAAGLKGNGINDLAGAKTPLMNLGLLRFSMCLDAADSLADGLIRMNCYIVFKNPGRFRFSSTMPPGSLGDLYWSAVEPQSRIRYDSYHRAWAVKENV